MDARTEDLGHIRAGVDDQRDGDAGEFGELERRENIRQQEIEEIELEQQRRVADDLGVDRRDGAKHFRFAKAQDGDQRADDAAEGYGDQRQQQRRAKAVQKVDAVFLQQLHNVLSQQGNPSFL